VEVNFEPHDPDERLLGRPRWREFLRDHFLAKHGFERSDLVGGCAEGLHGTVGVVGPDAEDPESLEHAKVVMAGMGVGDALGAEHARLADPFAEAAV
tara:strand:- start:235 stop:525 length:291 start_codon:yes stop_codon:yes gene_type:complete